MKNSNAAFVYVATAVLLIGINTCLAEEQLTIQITEKSLLALAEKGDTKSQKMLGMVYWQGELGAAANHKEAIKWFLKAAQSGDVEAKSLAARVYLSDSDFKNAAKLLKEAAEGGDLTAHGANPS